MHPLTISFICYVFFFVEGYAQKGNEKGFQCRRNVPAAAQQVILGALNEHRNKLHERLGTIEYSCGLAKNAHADVFRGSSLNILSGQSTYHNSWNETLKQAATSLGNNMINAAKKIGCQIKLTTLAEDGSHNVELDCRLGTGNGKSTANSMTDGQDITKAPRR